MYNRFSFLLQKLRSHCLDTVLVDIPTYDIQVLPRLSQIVNRQLIYRFIKTKEEFQDDLFMLRPRIINESVSRECRKEELHGSAAACKSRNVHDDVTCSIRPETSLPSWHLENLRIKRFARGWVGRSFDYFQPLREPHPRSRPT